MKRASLSFVSDFPNNVVLATVGRDSEYTTNSNALVDLKRTIEETMFILKSVPEHQCFETVVDDRSKKCGNCNKRYFQKCTPRQVSLQLDDSRMYPLMSPGK